eukprot:751228-Hanusia_phi.AAC.2
MTSVALRLQISSRMLRWRLKLVKSSGSSVQHFLVSSPPRNPPQHGLIWVRPPNLVMATFVTSSQHHSEPIPCFPLLSRILASSCLLANPASSSPILPQSHLSCSLSPPRRPYSLPPTRLSSLQPSQTSSHFLPVGWGPPPPQQYFVPSRLQRPSYMPAPMPFTRPFSPPAAARSLTCCLPECPDFIRSFSPPSLALHPPLRCLPV